MHDDLIRLRDRCLDRGDETDWSHLCRELHGPLAMFLKRRLRRAGQRPRREIVEELRQEVYCRLLAADCRRLRRCRATSNAQFLAWLQAVCANVACDFLRSSIARQRALPMADEVGEGDVPAADWLADARSDPERAVVDADLRRTLLRICRRSVDGPQAARNVAVFELAVLEGWSSREIAGCFELSIQGVDSIVSRLRRKLRDRGLDVPSRSGQTRRTDGGSLC